MRDFLQKKLNRGLMILMTVVMLIGAATGIFLNSQGAIHAGTSSVNDNGESPIRYQDKESVLSAIYADREQDAKLVILEIVPAKEATIFPMLTFGKDLYNKISDRSELEALYQAYHYTESMNPVTVAGNIASWHPFEILKLSDGTYQADYPNFFMDEIIDPVTYPDMYAYFTERDSSGEYKHFEVRTYIPGELNEIYEHDPEGLDAVFEDVSLVYISDQLQNNEVANLNAYIAGEITAEQTKNPDGQNIKINHYKLNDGVFEQVSLAQTQSATYSGYYKSEQSIVGKKDYSNEFDLAAYRSDYRKIEPGETQTYTFTNYSDRMENWNNFLLVLSDAADSSAHNYAVLRPDNYGFVTWEDGTFNTLEHNDRLNWNLQSNWNWDTFKNDLDGAKVTVSVTNNGPTAKVVMKIKPAGKSGKEYIQSYDNIAVNGYYLYMSLSCENSYLELEEESFHPCDFSWPVAEKLIRYIYGGSRYTNYDQAGATKTVPVSCIFNYGGSMTNTMNIYKFINTLCKTSDDPNDVDEDGLSSYYRTVLENNIRTKKDDGEFYRTPQGLITAAYVCDNGTFVDWTAGSAFLITKWTNSAQYAYNYVFKTSNANDSVFIVGSPNKAPWNSDGNAGTVEGRIHTNEDGEYMVSSVIEYFLGMDGSETKKTVRVLEVEPCADYLYDFDHAQTTDEKNAVFTNILALAKSLHMKDYYHITTGAGESDESSYEYFLKHGGQKRFDVTCVTTSDFNGMNEDLLSSYDLIVVGSQTGMMNTTTSWENGKEVFHTVYNDISLNGYVYLAYGDLIKVQTKLIGFAESDYIYNGVKQDYVIDVVSYYRDAVHYMNSVEYYADPIGNSRLKSNDISKKRMAELREYFLAGKAVLLANDVYSKKVLYPTSNLYGFVNTSNTADNVVSMERMGNDLLPVLGNEEFKLNDYAMYEDITRTNRVYNATFDADGLISSASELHSQNYYFDVDLTIRSGYSYQIKFLIDQNADGLFDESADPNKLVEIFYMTDEVHNGINSFAISLPKDYNGMFYWRIVAEESKNGKVTDRKNVDGYNLVYFGTDKTIKVLQVIPGNDKNASKVNLNLENNTMFQSLLRKASEKIHYDIQIDTLTAREYEAKFKDFADAGQRYEKSTSYGLPQDYLSANHYSMIVLGFADGFLQDDISNAYGAVDCINDFIEHNKSVLFTHDTMGYCCRDDHWTAYNPVTGTTTGELEGYSYSLNLTRYLRNAVGLDQFGISTGLLRNVPVTKEGNAITQLGGLTDFVTYRYSLAGWYDGHYDSKQKQNVANFDGFRDTLGNTTGTGFTYGRTPYAADYYGLITTTKVEEINQGQLTMYPYHISDIGDTIDVALTHAQWLQVDLEDPEVVVWYTLTGNGKNNYYGQDTKDSANNYYIYSKNNITYSGAGHSKMNSEIELKLFVNTIIRAATAGTFQTGIEAVNGSVSRDTYTIGDEEVDSYVIYCSNMENTAYVDFRAVNSGLANYEILHKLYPELSAEEIRTYLSAYTDMKIYYLEETVANNAYVYTPTVLLADYSERREPQKDSGLNRSAYLNGETRSFILYDASNEALQEEEIKDMEEYISCMTRAYTECKSSYTLLYITATAANGSTDTAVFKVVSRELYDLD